MYVLMFYQIALLTECLFTHITLIRALTTMYVLMFYQIALLTMPFYTHHTYVAVHLYVCVHVLSDCSAD